DGPEHARRETRSGERMPPEDVLWDAELGADAADLILEEAPERLDDFERHDLGKAADVVMRLDASARLRVPRSRLDDVRVDRALHKEVHVPHPLGLLLEAAHELFANKRPLPLRLRDVLQLLEKPIGRVEMDEPQPRAERRDDLLRLICTQQTGVDEDAGEAIADRARDERSGHGGVDPAGKRADRATVADPVADLGDGLL